MKKLIYILLITHSLHIVANKQSRAIKISQAIAEQKRNHVARAIASIQTIQRQHALQQQHAQAVLKKALKEKKTHKYKHEPIPFAKVDLAVDAQGYPTIAALQKLMHTEYFPKKKIDEIIISPFQGGAYTSKIYAVSLKNKPKRYIFFLKISTRYNSAQRLARLQTGDIGKYMIETRYADSKLPVRKKDLPIFAWVEKFYIYKNHKYDNVEKNPLLAIMFYYDEETIIEVTHAAQGQTGWSILHGNNEPLKLQFTKALAKALGSLQQIFMNYHGHPNDPEKWTTLCHGDLHFNNMLFNPATSKIYFIDTETAYKGCLISKDWRMFPTPALNQIFIKAYAATFPPQKRQALIDFHKKFTDKYYAKK